MFYSERISNYQSTSILINKCDFAGILRYSTCLSPASLLSITDMTFQKFDNTSFILANYVNFSHIFSFYLQSLTRTFMSLHMKTIFSIYILPIVFSNKLSISKHVDVYCLAIFYAECY